MKHTQLKGSRGWQRPWVSGALCRLPSARLLLWAGPRWRGCCHPVRPLRRGRAEAQEGADETGSCPVAGPGVERGARAPHAKSGGPEQWAGECHAPGEPGTARLVALGRHCALYKPRYVAAPHPAVRPVR